MILRTKSYYRLFLSGMLLPNMLKDTGKLPDQSLSAVDVQIPGKVLATCLSGSYLYGIPISGSSDLDYKYVYVLPNNVLLGLYSPTEKKLTRGGAIENLGLLNRKYDWEAHEVGKFARLLLVGNPSILELVAYPESLTNEQINEEHYLWTMLKAHANEFVTQKTYSQYLGYINGQLKRFENGQKLNTGSQGEYNNKWAYHMVRLSWELERIAQGKLPKVFHSTSRREYLLKIRYNEIPRAEILDVVKANVALAKHKGNVDELPEEGPKEWLNDWLLIVRRELGTL